MDKNNKDIYIGIDIGGSSVKIVIYEDANRKIICEFQKDIIHCNSVEEEIYVNVIKLIETKCYEYDCSSTDIKAIGFSLAANFDRETGDITKWPNNKKWNGFKLKEYLKNFYTTIFFEDDANCAAYAEQLFGCAKNIKNFIYITISTGIGGALVFNNKLYTGESGVAGEIGHIKVCGVKNKCNCGRIGCLQTVSSGTAIRKFLINKCNGKVSTVASETKLEKLIENPLVKKEWLNEAFNKCIKYLCEAVVMLEHLLDIHFFVLGGGISENKKFFLEPICRKVKKYSNSIRLEKTLLGKYNSAIGALNICYERVTRRKIYE